MTDEEIEAMVRELIEVHLDEHNRKAAIEWLDKLIRAAADQLDLIDPNALHEE